MKVNDSQFSETLPPSAAVINPLLLGVENLRNHSLVLLDTPGFDDTSTDDMTILKEIADWLAQSSVILEFHIQ